MPPKPLLNRRNFRLMLKLYRQPAARLLLALRASRFLRRNCREVVMSTQHHMDEREQDVAEKTMSWAGGVLVAIAVLAFFYFAM